MHRAKIPPLYGVDMIYMLSAHFNRACLVIFNDLLFQLTDSAQKWANYLLAANTFQHSGTPNRGDNLYMWSTSGGTVPAQVSKDHFL